MLDMKTGVFSAKISLNIGRVAQTGVWIVALDPGTGSPLLLEVEQARQIAAAMSALADEAEAENRLSEVADRLLAAETARGASGSGGGISA